MAGGIGGEMSKIFHVHTYRCGHASEEREKEYMEKAVSMGAKEIWFTDHVPYPGDAILWRMQMADFPDYVETVKRLREEYKGSVDVKLGLELEYLPGFLDYYRKLKNSGEFDVMLLGQHFSELSEGVYTYEHPDRESEAGLLARGMIDGMDTGLFDVVAHPDQIFRHIKEWNAEAEGLSQQIKEAAVRNNVILEINVNNIFGKKRNSYRPEFWAELPEGLQTVYGTDAHSVEELEKTYQWILENS